MDRPGLAPTLESGASTRPAQYSEGHVYPLEPVRLALGDSSYVNGYDVNRAYFAVSLRSLFLNVFAGRRCALRGLRETLNKHCL